MEYDSKNDGRPSVIGYKLTLFSILKNKLDVLDARLFQPVEDRRLFEQISVIIMYVLDKIPEPRMMMKYIDIPSLQSSPIRWMDATYLECKDILHQLHELTIIASIMSSRGNVPFFV